MIDPIWVTATQEVDDETKERSTEVASTLSETNRLDANFSLLKQRQMAAREIADLAESEPATVIPHLPVIVRTLDEELTRGEFENSAADIVYTPISREIRQQLAEVIETLSIGPAVAQYESSDESLSSFLGVLARAVIKSDDESVFSHSLYALGRFVQYRPEMVAEAIADEGDSTAILNLLTRIIHANLTSGSNSPSSNINSPGSLEWWIRFVAVILFRNQHPDDLPSTHRFRTLANRLQNEDDVVIVILGDLLKKITPSHREIDEVCESGWESISVYNPISEPLKAVSVNYKSGKYTNAPYESDRSESSPIKLIQRQGPDSDAAEAFGEVIAACPRILPNPPWSLINHVRELEHRQYAARALGGVAVAGANTTSEQIQLAIRWIKAKGTTRYGEMLGEIVAAHGDEIDIPDPIKPLVEKVRTAVGQPRIDAALALGVAVYQSGDPSTAVDPTPILRRHIREGESFGGPAAKGLGEAVITMDPQTCAVSAPSAAIEYVRGDMGRSRKFSTRALGLAVATDSPSDLPTKLVSDAHKGKGQRRWKAGRTLGELIGILDVLDDFSPWPESLLDQLRGTSHPLRFERAEMVGVAIASLVANAHQIEDPVRLHRAVKYLERGKLDIYGINNKKQLVRSVLSGPDRLLLYILIRGGPARYDIQEVVGELSVAGAIPRHTSALFEPLVQQISQASNSKRRHLARTLGEAIAVTFGNSSELGIICALTRRTQTEEGILRYQAAQALGEAIALFEDSYLGRGVEGIVADAVQDASGQERWNLARALGELHAAVEEPNSVCDPVEALVDKATNNNGIDWSATAAIGAIAILDPDGTDFASSVPDDLIAAIISTEGTDYESGLEAVGSVVLGIVDTFVTKSVSDAIESQGRNKRVELLPTIMATGLLSLGEFLDLLTQADPADSGQGLETYFDSDIRNHVISALQTLLRRSGTDMTGDVRHLLESNLTSEETPTLDPESRLAIVDCLAICPPATRDQ